MKMNRYSIFMPPICLWLCKQAVTVTLAAEMAHVRSCKHCACISVLCIIYFRSAVYVLSKPYVVMPLSSIVRTPIILTQLFSSEGVTVDLEKKVTGKN